MTCQSTARDNGTEAEHPAMPGPRAGARLMKALGIRKMTPEMEGRAGDALMVLRTNFQLSKAATCPRRTSTVTLATIVLALVGIFYIVTLLIFPRA